MLLTFDVRGDQIPFKVQMNPVMNSATGEMYLLIALVSMYFCTSLAKAVRYSWIDLHVRAYVQKKKLMPLQNTSQMPIEIY